jgi:tRNA-specific 2-thiouridylase
LFIIATDVEQNVIYVGQGDSHPGLYREVLHISADEVHWVRPDLALKSGEQKRFNLRIRYRQPLQDGVVEIRDEGAYLIFDTPQRGAAAGQFASWYDGDEVIGSGAINH